MLSPLTVNGLRATLCADQGNVYAARHGISHATPRSLREPPERVIMWRCPICDELHDDEDDAADCCEDVAPVHEATGLHVEEAARHCPVCGASHHSPEAAADCCLWHDLAFEQRGDVARRVLEGATWLQAIEAVDGALPEQLCHLRNLDPA